ncbi:ricin B-like lectin R40G3 [Vigna umbellata]|uniref:ricin B-like lectin R40G3 n=1 Tax=Vigna umbellata TaxID=87088 RepID=UPI001F5F6F85|nr:ricin B-like lectin R40G3 [Vigna umbellata]
MSFPFGHTHHRRDDDDDERRNAYPPPGSTFPNPHQQPPPPFYGAPQPPPPQPETNVFHTSHVPPPGHVSQDFNYSAPTSHHHHESDHGFSHGYSPAPAPAYYPPPGTTSTVHHVAHESHHHTPHFSSHNSPSSTTTVTHVGHQTNTGLRSKPTVRVVTKAAPDFSLTIRHGQVILAPSDPSNEYQHWYKDEKYSTRVKDAEGCPAFSLVNKATGEALKHSIGSSHPVRLIAYNPDYLDESILWTESRDLGDGHRAIRMVNNIHLNVDAFHGDKKSGGVHDGTTIVLWDWNKGDNQQWKILPY